MSHEAPKGHVYPLVSLQAVLAKAKKWGNSIGLVIPSDLVKREGIRPGDTVEVVLRRRLPRLEELGGTVRLRHNLEDVLLEMEEGSDEL